MTNYREILRLHSLGLNKTEIASSCQCARNTVAATLQRAANCNLQWPLPEEMSDKQLSERLFPSSTSKPVYKMPDYAYCTDPAPGQDGKTCREIGASSSFRSKVENNDVWKVHQRAYKKYFARIRSGLMTKGEFEVWSRQAADLRDAALERYARAESEEERQRIAQDVAAELNAE